MLRAPSPSSTPAYNSTDRNIVTQNRTVCAEQTLYDIGAATKGFSVPGGFPIFL